MGSEKRAFQRKTLTANICIEIPVLGKILDVSRSGARLAVDDPRTLPDEFMLALNPELHRWCRVVWRKDHEVGVIYKAAPAQYRQWFPTKRDERVVPQSAVVPAPVSE